MKLVFAISTLLALSTSAYAGKVTIASDENKSVRSKLSEVPAELVGIMLDQGIKKRDLGHGVFEFLAKNIHCDYRNHNEYDVAGVSSEVCRLNSTNKRDTKIGQRLYDGRSLALQLSKIQTEIKDIYFTDCGMGYCGTFVKSIRCAVNTDYDAQKTDAVVCELTTP